MSSKRKASVWRTEKERERECVEGSWGSGVAGLFAVTDTLHIQQELFDKRRSSAYRMEKILCHIQLYMHPLSYFTSAETMCDGDGAE